MGAYSRLWLSELGYQAKDLSPLELMLRLHFLGKDEIEDTPLFSIDSKNIRKILNGEQSKNYTLRDLNRAFNTSKEQNIALITPLILYQFTDAYNNLANHRHNKKLELSKLAPGLWIKLKGHSLVVSSSPNSPPWHFLEEGQVIGQFEKENRKLKREADQVMSLLHRMQQVNRLDSSPSGDSPAQAGSTILGLPSANNPNLWYSLKALDLPINNFTAYPDSTFIKIRESYHSLKKAIQANSVGDEAKNLANALLEGYRTIAGQTYQHAATKELFFPTEFKLEVESLFYRIPFTNIVIGGYFLSVAALLLWNFIPTPFTRSLALLIGCLTISFHTLNIGLRCYLLSRPPVSNMAETVIFVPWVMVMASVLLAKVYRTALPLICSFFGAATLFLILKYSKINLSLENVQAVLDSQFWLSIHVLMVVGSYGAFLLAGILGHIYLFMHVIWKAPAKKTQKIGKLILQSMFIGLALLIPGTILGGVWAAQSWGRFWDWDPKESWAFITCSVYLICVHGYYLNVFRYFGLAIGSIAGLMVVAFTWYGVNYILGTGLHSYGFGSGGEGVFYAYLVIESIFLGFNSILGYVKCPSKEVIMQ